MDELKMPEREEGDGAVGLKWESRLGDNRLWLKVETDGAHYSVPISEHNAWRLFGILAVMLEIPLSKRVGKAIRL